jgi:hypothetical protein
MNLARSETTGFSPFYLNYACVPWTMIWDSETEYPGVAEFAVKMKEVLMKAHDTIIAARVKQTDQANRSRKKSDLREDDLVYLSTKNLRLPKGRARKLTPKYIGPFKIVREVSPGTLYQLELPKELKARGIHDMFHVSLLRKHYPNDDRRFPGRQLHQLPGFGQNPTEWNIDHILSHSCHGKDALFEVQWTTGDVTWVPYVELRDTIAMDGYLEAMGTLNPRGLNLTTGGPNIGAAAISVMTGGSLNETERGGEQKEGWYKGRR